MCRINSLSSREYRTKMNINLSALKKEIINKYNLVLMSDYVIYTDGGCCNTSVYGEGGSAYVILHNNEIFARNSKGFIRTSSNRMEMLAILSAVNALPDNSSCLIHSDSQYAINVLSGHWKAKINTDLVNSFKEKVKSKKIKNLRFKWVKGHNGSYYNEMVDSMCTSEIEKIVAKYNLPKDRFTKKKKNQQQIISFIY